MKGAVVIIDAADRAGRGIVQAALRADRPVVAVSKDSAELARLRNESPRADLVTLDGSIANESDSALLAAALRDLERPIDGIVIATSGAPLSGRILDHSVEKFQQRLQDDLFPQLAAARSLLPLLTRWGRNGSYVVIGSPGAEHPWSGYSYCSIAAAAMTMLVRVLHEEARALDVRVQMLAVNRPIRTAENCGCAGKGWPDAVAIGERALALIDRIEPRIADEAVVSFTPRPALAQRAKPAATSLASPDAQAPFSADYGGQAVLEQTWKALEPILNSTPKTRDK
jgi:NAD(P)-dependent dehydrogenase (short-subunit alcohol dehydrogenase family)